MEARKSLISVLWLIGQPLLLNVLGIPAMAYIIRALGPLGYGEWALATALVNSMAFISNLGLHTLFVRSIAQEPESVSERLAEQLGLRGGLAIAAGLLSLCLCLCLGYHSTVLICVAITAVGLLLSVLAGTYTDVLFGLQLLSTYARVNLSAGLVLTIASVLVMWKAPGPIALAASYLTGPATSLIVMVFILNRLHIPVCHRWRPDRYRELLRQSRVLAVNGIFATLRDRAEQLLVPKLVGITEFGYFAAGTLPADRLTIVPDGFNTAFFPLIARHSRATEEDALHHVVLHTVLSFVACIPLAILITFLAQPIASLLFPKGAAICRDILRITIWSVPLLGITFPMSCALEAAGRYSEAARASMRATVCSTVFSFLLIYRWGILGACLSWVIRPGLLAIFLLPLFIQTFPKVLPRLPFGRVLSCAVLMALPLWIFTVQRNPTFWTIGIGGCLAIMIYIGALILLRVFAGSGLRALLCRDIA